MKKILFILVFLISVGASAQIAYFPTVDSLRRFTDRYIRNSAIEAFTNLRLNTTLKGIEQFLDSARLVWGGGLPDTLYAYRSLDSVYFRVGINGTPVFMYIDSVGAGSGSGDVDGPSASVNDEVVLFSGTTGKIIKRSTGLTYDVTDFKLSNTSTGSTNGAVYDMYLNKGTPVIEDRLGEIHFYGNTANGTKTQMGAFYAQSPVITNGAAGGRLLMNVRVNGTDREFFNAVANATNDGVGMKFCANYYFDETTGKFHINNASIPTNNYVQFQYNSNGPVIGGIANTNTGSSAYTEWNISNNSTLSGAAGLRMLNFGSSWSTVGPYKSLGGTIYTGSSQTGGLNIGTGATAPIRFYTNGEADANERGSFTSAGNFIVRNLDTDLSAPTTSGVTKMVVSDDIGQLSFANIPGGGGAPAGSNGDIQMNTGGAFAVSGANWASNIFKISGTNSTSFTNATLQVFADASKLIYAGFNTTSDYGIIGAANVGVAHHDLVLAPSGGNVGVGIQPGSTEKFRVNGIGRFGVGTGAAGITDPTLFLSHTGNTALLMTDVTNAISGYHIVGTSGSESGYIFGSLTNHDLTFRSNNATRAQIKAGGNFLIGSTTDGAGKLQVTGDIYTSKHLTSQQAFTSAVGGAGMGTSPSFTVTGGDVSGKIELTTGSSPTSGGTILTLTFLAAYANSPAVILTPGNSAAAGLSGTSMPYISSVSTTAFVFTAGSVALAATTTYVWYYLAAN